VPALINRGVALKNLRQTDKALAELNLALAIDPNSAIAWINRGETLFVMGRFEEALASFDRALSIDAGQPLAWLGRANILMLTSRVPDALAACQRAIAIEPTSVKGLTQIGQCHALQGRRARCSFFDRAPALAGRRGCGAEQDLHPTSANSDFTRSIRRREPSGGTGLIEHFHAARRNTRMIAIRADVWSWATYPPSSGVVLPHSLFDPYLRTTTRAASK
jgi:tetratricopeptide (TPR) repeat protein